MQKIVHIIYTFQSNRDRYKIASKPVETKKLSWLSNVLLCPTKIEICIYNKGKEVKVF